MADCSYSRCVQERRNIRRELQKWTKNMVYIVGLERIAEELMGRRKWKLYQECMSRTQQQQQHLPINNNNNNNNTVVLDNGAKVNIVTTTVKREPSTTPQPQAEEERDEKTTTIGADTAAAATTPLTNTATTTTATTTTDIIEDEQERLKDWSPQSKCYFCVDGKLDSDHTQHGALSPRPSDSDSSDSPSDSESPPTLIPSVTSLQLLKNNNHHHHPAHHPSMTTIDASMASLAAVAAITGGGAGGQGAQVPFYPPAGLFATAPSWYLGSLARNFHQQQQQQQQQQERMEVVESKVNNAEQPLDLSSKPGNASTSANNNNTANCLENKLATNIRLPALDTKHIFNCDFRAKPRMSAVAGRRTYTEEELQAALRDIQSGKLGTRRAAVIYGIPRSTLRNKVYKLAMERERETHLVAAVPIEDEGMDDDKELSGAEEEKEVEKALQGPLLSMDDIVRFSAIETPEAVKALLQQKHKDSSGAPDVWGGMEHSALGPYIQMFMSGQIAGAKDADLIPMLPEIMRKIIAEEQHLNNGETTHDKLMRNSQPSPANSVKTERLKTDSSDMDTDDSPSNVILKIPSYKPTTSKNGGGDIYRSGASESGSIALSPPVMSESGSPPIMATANMMSLREAIAKSITEKLQQSPEPLKMHPEIDMKRVGFTPPLTAMAPVIKNHNHQSEPQTPPLAGSIVAAPTASLMHSRSYPPTTGGPGMNNSKQQHQQQQQQQQQSNNNSNSSQGGKGTRPKRGKYRNYDRDSLVEAVRAVQRGEMSVHRAGSYYGVPHSTLEYKVKERHLMRPRKRDPKPNPVDEKIASMKQQEIRNSIPDKMKPVIKPPQKFPPTSPNGMKMPPMFDPTMTPIGYSPQPFPFWPHPSFPHLPLEYPRNPGTSQFPPNPEQFFASQMMQRLQEQSIRCHPDAAGASAAGGPNNAASAAAIAKSAREMAESLYDGTGANGSFLDGIIRSSLESGVPVGADKLNSKEEKNVAPENMSNKALLDQLCRNSRITPLPLPKPSVNVDPNSSGDESYRKATSPLNFTKNSRKDRDSPIGSSYKNDTRDDIHTIELSNDSNDSSSTKEEDSPAATSVLVKNSNQSPPPRIYVKPQFQELTKPENLKPEVMVRFRADSMVHQPLPSPPHDHDDLEPMTERNGIIENAAATGSASDHKPDVAQD